MKALEFLSIVPPVKRDNFNRDSSACFSKSGAVIHSGVHRSTAFVSLPYALASLLWAKELGQAALNGWIESTIEGCSLEDCELTAISRQFPEWNFSILHTKQGTVVTAVSATGQFQTRIGAGSIIELGRRLK